MDLNDLNDTLKFDITTYMRPKLGFVNSKLSDTNISITNLSKMDISAKGILKDIEFKVKLENLGIKKDDIKSKYKTFFSDGKDQPYRRRC